jgi:hypothetical protein
LLFLNWVSKLSFSSRKAATYCWKASSSVLNSWFIISSCSVMGKRSLSMVCYNLFLADSSSFRCSSLVVISSSRAVILWALFLVSSLASARSCCSAFSLLVRPCKSASSSSFSFWNSFFSSSVSLLDWSTYCSSFSCHLELMVCISA